MKILTKILENKKNVQTVNRPIGYLEVLNLSKNAIGRIGNESLNGLVRLKSIDLRHEVQIELSKTLAFF